VWFHYTKTKKVETYYAEDLILKKRYAEAARVTLDYTGDVRQAMIALVEGNMFSEARRIVSTCS
jgi:elongator complex protein 1